MGAIVIGIIMIVGGLSGNFVMRGGAGCVNGDCGQSSLGVAGLGLLLVIYGLYRIGEGRQR